jgi:hypothetical protein
MRTLAFLELLAIHATTCIALRANDNSLVTGVWRGKLHNLPGVTMVISDEGGSLSGAVLFYLVRRTNGGPPSSTLVDPEPMFNIKFTGNTVNFQISHRRAHPPETLNDPPVNFVLKVTGNAQGVLIRDNDEKYSYPVSRQSY